MLPCGVNTEGTEDMASRELGFGSLGLFSDEVFSSTDLNRRSGEVLNRARNGPVTIARNNERFALLRRDQAAGLIQGLAQLKEVIELFEGAMSAKAGLKPPASMVWTTHLNEDDSRSMINEVLAACARASTVNDWSAVGDLIHEWKESAAVIHSGVLRRSTAEPSDEQLVPDPASDGGMEGCA
jgi:hypothetical protein